MVSKSPQAQKAIRACRDEETGSKSSKSSKSSKVATSKQEIYTKTLNVQTSIVPLSKREHHNPTRVARITKHSVLQNNQGNTPNETPSEMKPQ